MYSIKSNSSQTINPGAKIRPGFYRTAIFSRNKLANKPKKKKNLLQLFGHDITSA